MLNLSLLSYFADLTNPFYDTELDKSTNDGTHANSTNRPNPGDHGLPFCTPLIHFPLILECSRNRQKKHPAVECIITIFEFGSNESDPVPNVWYANRDANVDEYDAWRRNW